MTIRDASHAGSWYTDHSPTLSRQLDSWLNQVDITIKDVGGLPQSGARIIIAPHAGYAYSGPAAAWAYKALDLSKCKRVFLLGPSHHLHLSGCALSKHTHYATPMGNLALDTNTISDLRSGGQFKDMSTSSDSAEHSLEMHLPYIYHMLEKKFSSSTFPPLVPILVGSTEPATEKRFGAVLAPYLADASNVFVISSDFCHWGSRFDYTYYLSSNTKDPSQGVSLNRKHPPKDIPIYESIARIDRLAMQSIETGQHDAFLATLRDTGNTVCGRHPIGVMMAAIEFLRQRGTIEEDIGHFRFIRYERSSEVVEASDSSVSYASAFASL